jgi:hypothetical protein
MCCVIVLQTPWEWMMLLQQSDAHCLLYMCCASDTHCNCLSNAC